ncbi:MAG: hypothetical protein R3B91_05990 [Planctomycetaceae bacterium]
MASWARAGDDTIIHDALLEGILWIPHQWCDGKIYQGVSVIFGAGDDSMGEERFVGTGVASMCCVEAGSNNWFFFPWKKWCRAKGGDDGKWMAGEGCCALLTGAATFPLACHIAAANESEIQPIDAAGSVGGRRGLLALDHLLCVKATSSDPVCLHG